jgi:hypothetical protein
MPVEVGIARHRRPNVGRGFGDRGDERESNVERQVVVTRWALRQAGVAPAANAMAASRDAAIERTIRFTGNPSCEGARSSYPVGRPTNDAL